jgi:hypothetical protein
VPDAGRPGAVDAAQCFHDLGDASPARVLLLSERIATAAPDLQHQYAAQWIESGCSEVPVEHLLRVVHLGADAQKHLNGEPRDLYQPP